MAVFKFHLSPVLKYRRRIQEGKEQELRVINGEYQRRENEIVELERRLYALNTDIEVGEGQILSAVDLRFQDAYGQQLSRLIELRRRELTAVEAERSVKMAEVVEAMRAVKSLEKLRARLEAKFRHEQATGEQKFNDEVGQQKFLRRRERQ